jgi:catechol 2,3-dioxygenase-like lactoylglutathione lyase family enzyme
MPDSTKTVRAPATRVGTFAPFGLLEQDQETARQFLAQVADAGIDYVCCGDHVSFFGGSGFDGLVQATALAMLHPTLPVHVGVYLLPLRHPVLVARQLADFARIAPGRLVFGVGVGGEDRHEISVCGVEPATRGERMPMSHVRRFDHVGLTVADLDVVTAFFVALGLEVEGRTFVEGEFLDTVCGIPGSRTEIVMLKPPGDGTRLELSSFVRPDSVPGSPAAMANELGLRNVAFEVNDLQAAVDWASAEGYGLVGGIGEYEGAWRMAYVRGPEGIIVSLAERIG